MTYITEQCDTSLHHIVLCRLGSVLVLRFVRRGCCPSLLHDMNCMAMEHSARLPCEYWRGVNVNLRVDIYSKSTPCWCIQLGRLLLFVIDRTYLGTSARAITVRPGCWWQVPIVSSRLNASNDPSTPVPPSPSPPLLAAHASRHLVRPLIQARIVR
jgi:hypothetical protein